jgi:hypothetical protein
MTPTGQRRECCVGGVESAAEFQAASSPSGQLEDAEEMLAGRDFVGE